MSLLSATTSQVQSCVSMEIRKADGVFKVCGIMLRNETDGRKGNLKMDQPAGNIKAWEKEECRLALTTYRNI